MTMRVNLIHSKLVFLKKIQKLNILKEKREKKKSHPNSAIHFLISKKSTFRE